MWVVSKGRMPSAASWIGATLFLLLLLAGCRQTPPARDEQWNIASTALETDKYILRVGDVVAIKLFYHPELNETVTIRPDGMISMQLIDEVKAAGLAPSELDEVITGKFVEFLERPDVSVIVREATAQHIYVGGEIQLPGLIPLTAGLSCLQAIFQAGGYRNTAAPSSVVVLRNQGTPEPEMVILNLSRELREAGTHNDVLLRPQDIIFVPKSVIAQIDLFVEQYIDKLLPIQFTMGLSYNFSQIKSEGTSTVKTKTLD